ncbi:hypothetical protein JW977_04760 [Candidatus Falkowbacteria bacterium]|nr:hypothetical protein [Candidatus Falkowbacteria bacterium]
MVKKKKKKIKLKKVKASKKRIKKSVKKLPENVFGQQIEIQQEVVPIVEVVENENEIERQREIIRNILTEPETESEKVEEEEIFECISMEPEVEYEDHEIPQKDLSQRQKVILMYVAIASIMCFIVFFWLISAKNSLGHGFQKQTEDEGLSAIINEVGIGINNFSDIIDAQKKQLSDFTAEATDIIIQEQLKNEVANKLKEQLQNSNSNLNTNQ